MNARQQLRETIRIARNRLTSDEQFQASDAASDLLVMSDLFKESQHIACYHAVNGEIDTQAIIETIWQTKKKSYFPILSSSKKGFLHFGEYLPHAKLTMNQFGIPEPECLEQHCVLPQSLDLVIVPLIAFDRKGSRLGTGSGYYDRTFAFKNENPSIKKPILCGYAFSFQEASEIEAKPWDIKLDYVFTENGQVDINKAD